jgi:hypothetical protein
MLRAEFHQLANAMTLGLEGRFVGEWAEQVKSLVTKRSLPPKLIIDLTEVTYVDSVGEQVLIWFSSIGATFIAEICYARDVCERLHLPLKGDPGNPSSERHNGTLHPST